MIIIVSKDKHSKHKTGNTLKLYQDWFQSNPNTWIKSKDLEKELGTKCTRIYINKLRCNGMPIISNIQKGYKLSLDKQEIINCYEALRQRALIAITAAKSIKKFI